jgi:hypothetical protein
MCEIKYFIMQTMLIANMHSVKMDKCSLFQTLIRQQMMAHMHARHHSQQLALLMCETYKLLVMVGYKFEKNTHQQLLSAHPKITMKPNATMTAMEGGDVTIRCAGLGTPTPTYAWFKVCWHFT